MGRGDPEITGNLHPWSMTPRLRAYPGCSRPLDTLRFYGRHSRPRAPSSRRREPEGRGITFLVRIFVGRGTSAIEGARARRECNVGRPPRPPTSAAAVPCGIAVQCRTGNPGVPGPAIHAQFWRFAPRGAGLKGARALVAGAGDTHAGAR